MASLDLSLLTELALKLRHIRRAARIAVEAGAWPESVTRVVEDIIERNLGDESGHVDSVHCWCQPEVQESAEGWRILHKD